MLISPLWSHGFGRKFQSPPRTISTKFQNRIYFWNQKISRRSGHISLISVSDSFLILSCLSFGVNWKISISTMIHSFGFFTAYLALICSIFAFRLQDEVDSSLLFAYTVFTLLLLIAIVLSQIKLMVPHFFPTLGCLQPSLSHVRSLHNHLAASSLEGSETVNSPPLWHYLSHRPSSTLDSVTLWPLS
jgi:hypothetical protein